MSYRTGLFFIEAAAVTCLAVSLSAAAVPQLTRHLDTARDNVLAYNVQVLQQTIEIFAVMEGHYPACLTELIEAGYLYSLPVNPRTGEPDYSYDPVTGKIGPAPRPAHR